MIGDGDGGHVQRFGARYKLVNPAQAIQQRVFGMDVKMDEFVFAHNGQMILTFKDELVGSAHYTIAGAPVGVRSNKESFAEAEFLKAQLRPSVSVRQRQPHGCQPHHQRANAFRDFLSASGNTHRPHTLLKNGSGL
jgi:hypothetical protein